MKRYIQNWKKIYKFEEFGDYENFFIELCYVANKRDFKSELLAPLTNKIAQNGKPIFANENIDFTKYVLLNERIEEQTNELMFVYETYGFAPLEAYVDYTAEPVTFFGKADPSGAVKAFLTSMRYIDSAKTKIGISVDNIADFGLGDTIVFHRPKGQTIGYTQYAINSADLVIIEKTSTELIVADFRCYNTDEGVAVDINPVKLFEDAYNPCYIEKAVSTRLPTTKISAVKNVITYSIKFPDTESKFVVYSGTGEADTITTGTAPNIDEWKQMIAEGKYINVQDSTIEIIYPKTFFKKTQKKTLAK